MSDCFGIDISYFQRGINLKKCKEEGIEFVIIRSSFTNSKKEFKKDSTFETHYNNAKENNLDVGVYHYSKACSYEEGRQEAINLYNNCLINKKFEYPICMDVEDECQANAGKERVTDAIKGFCETLENLGYYVCVYANINYIENYMDYKELKKLYDFWIALWNQKEPDVERYNYGIWQFGGETNKIRSNKIAGFVCDQNYSYRQYKDIMIKNCLNGYHEMDNDKNKISIGDKVIIKCAYASSSKSLIAIHTAKTGSECYVTNIYRGTRFPYQLGVKKDNISSKYTIGFANENAIIKK